MPEGDGDQGGLDPAIVGTTPPGAANLDALRRKIAPRQVNDRSPQDPSGYGQLKAWQQYLDNFYRSEQ